MAKFLVNDVLPRLRRDRKRKPTSPLDDNAEPASEAQNVEDELVERQETDHRAAQVHNTLAAQTQSGLTLRILDALRRGIEGHQNLADELECSLEEIRAAFRRITRRMEKVRAGGDEEWP